MKNVHACRIRTSGSSPARIARGQLERSGAAPLRSRLFDGRQRSHISLQHRVSRPSTDECVRDEVFDQGVRFGGGEEPRVQEPRAVQRAQAYRVGIHVDAAFVQQDLRARDVGGGVEQPFLADIARRDRRCGDRTHRRRRRATRDSSTWGARHASVRIQRSGIARGPSQIWCRARGITTRGCAASVRKDKSCPAAWSGSRWWKTGEGPARRAGPSAREPWSVTDELTGRSTGGTRTGAGAGARRRARGSACTRSTCRSRPA